MSSFLCDDKLFNGVVSSLAHIRDRAQWFQEGTRYAISDLDKKYQDVNLLAEDLYKMNLAALDARYGDGDEQDNGYKFRRVLPHVTMVKLYKDTGCLLYQCSEGDVIEWKLYRDMRKISDAIAHDIVRRLPEYEKGEWG